MILFYHQSSIKVLLLIDCGRHVTLNLKLGQIFLPNLFQIHSQMQCQDSLTPSPATNTGSCLASLKFCSFWYFVGIVMAALVAATFFSLIEQGLDTKPSHYCLRLRQTLLNYSYSYWNHTIHSSRQKIHTSSTCMNLLLSFLTKCKTNINCVFLYSECAT